MKDPETEEYVVTVTMRSSGNNLPLLMETTSSHEVLFEDGDSDDDLNQLPSAFAAMAKMLAMAKKTGLLKHADDEVVNEDSSTRH